MYGAILGDIIGSRFEFDRGGKTKEFELFTEECEFTDDTVMTVAVAEGLMNAGKEANADEIRREVISSMRKWGKIYPDAGYGGRFYQWLFYRKEMKPYGSYGNGSAMRVSAAGWLYDSLERTREAARATADVTHNHPEGIKGAECTAAVIFLARTGASKEDIRAYVEKEFGYDMNRTVDELRLRHQHVETCQDSLPKALCSFMEGESYEDVVRNAVSLGGDTDTLAAIAGSMAEAFFGVPVFLYAEAEHFLPDDMTDVLNKFTGIITRSGDEKNHEYRENLQLRSACEVLSEQNTKEQFLLILNLLISRMLEDGQAPTPMVDKNHVFRDLSQMSVGRTYTLEGNLKLTIDYMKDGEEKFWIPLFTDNDETQKQPTTGIIVNMPIERIIRCGLNDTTVEGVVINPFSRPVTLGKEVLQVLVDALEKAKEAK